MKELKKLLFLFALGALVLVSCKEDDPEEMLISTIVAEGTSFEDGSNVTADLNGASSAADVPLNATITITFDKAVDASTVNNTVISISSSDGDVVSTVTASGSSVTVNPDADLERGTSYTLNIGALKADDGGNFLATSRTFLTEGRAPVEVPNESSMIAYYGFDGTTDDLLGSFNPDNEVAISFGEDRYGQGNSTANFDGDESIIEIPNGDMFMDSDDFTISFWVKTNSSGHVNQDGNPSSHFVLGLGAFFGFQFEIPADFNSCKLAMSYVQEDGNQTSEDLWFNGSGEDKDNGGWQGWDYVANLTGSGGVPGLLQDRWAHILCTYDATEKQGRMFINGDLMKSQDFDLWPDCDPPGSCKQAITGVSYRGNASDVEPILALGFIKSIDSPMWADTPWGDYAKPTSNHFKGDLDDIRIFNAPFSADDAKALYDAEKN